MSPLKRPPLEVLFVAVPSAGGGPAGVVEEAKEKVGFEVAGVVEPAGAEVAGVAPNTDAPDGLLPQRDPNDV